MNDYYAINTPSYELSHHGIKGQKWGVRRYQNEDGTLTDAGKAKLSSYKETQTRKTSKYYDKKINKVASKIISSGDKNGKKTAKLQALKTLKSAELKQVSNMDYNSMVQEKKAVSRQVEKTLATVAAFGAIGFITIPSIHTPQTIKSYHRGNVRLSSSDN